jgi:hypothetical protein
MSTSDATEIDAEIRKATRRLGRRSRQRHETAKAVAAEARAGEAVSPQNDEKPASAPAAAAPPKAEPDFVARPIPTPTRGIDPGGWYRGSLTASRFSERELDALRALIKIHPRRYRP